MEILVTNEQQLYDRTIQQRMFDFGISSQDGLSVEDIQHNNSRIQKKSSDGRGN